MTAPSIETATTKHMRAERIAERHFAHMVALYQDPQVMATLGGVQSVTKIREGFDKNVAHWDEHGFGLWCFFDRETGQFAGRGGLRKLIQDGQPEIEIAYAVPVSHWGKGRATEIAALSADIAFNQLQMQNVVAFTLHENKASRRVMEKLHMTYERDIIHADLPHVLYRITREQYQAKV
ncbi:MAG: GNAT family N-acetyltransferase [Phycisphaerae bacterium]